ncbi:sporulation-specific N-acetylmuramoyl-L-alanine amidase CwlC [[Clostridium] sordellii]|uniref:N-acetylmuramoyl-L-alanine amidase family protein n=1 Tax=Paraclostridium sordellii TaxID=1505 RepID=UPI0005E1F573|nr:N-acetylmuramoyl-L-alanine amidase [Paeniclostridium sordellii]CEN84150.1 sporulation-specific N-acetylmuramoyl-L-alanine amidase CwlC [[Clostridium] sordellii] [Paeniclostridium sordellii]CEO09680.1 sporulation-specific N-acetylmuramoyl-L-alanine amidase CwlC [[Clostridium] sordellii] [Paeniclostridium sordellii]
MSKKVYIDLGHGGNDSGAINKARNVLEKNIVLEVGELVESKLKECNLDVKLSRNGDITKSLKERTNEANKWGADALVSIHVNDAENRNAKGLETYCYKFKYRKLADYVHSEMIKADLYTQNRGVKEGNLHMVRESNMSACLVELGFINNENDINLLTNKKDEFATAIAKGICSYLSVEYIDNKHSKPGKDKIKDGDYSGKKAEVVNVKSNDVLNVRYDRNPRSKDIGDLKTGSIVTCEYCLNGWMSIRGYKGNKGLGYVNAHYLKIR